MAGSTNNERLQSWVDEWVAILRPDDVHWCDGSADEYDNAANPPGSPVAASYQGMITAQTGDTVTRVDSSNIMSLGSSVQRWNYAPFLEALKKITSMSDWSL